MPYYECDCTDCHVARTFVKRRPAQLWAALHSEMTDHDVPVTEIEADPIEPSAPPSYPKRYV